MTYDDLLTRLSDTLDGPERRRSRRRACARATASCSSTSSRTPTRCSGRSCAPRSATATTTLVLIGDPKQAIYAFRGADVYAYIEAAQAAGAQATLTVNWRSDQGLLDAYDALFGGAKLGHEGIVYRQVSAAPANRSARLHGAPDPAPLRVRVVPRDGVRPDAAGLRASRTRRASTSPATSRPTSSRCCARAPTIDGVGPHPARAHRRARAHEQATRRGCATRWRRSTSPPSSTAPAASSAPSPPASGCACSRRSSGPPTRRAPAPPR